MVYFVFISERHFGCPEPPAADPYYKFDNDTGDYSYGGCLSPHNNTTLPMPECTTKSQ